MEPAPPQSAVTKCHIKPAMPDELPDVKHVNDACRLQMFGLMCPHEFDAINYPSKYLRLRRGIQKKGDEW